MLQNWKTDLVVLRQIRVRYDEENNQVARRRARSELHQFLSTPPSSFCCCEPRGLQLACPALTCLVCAGYAAYRKLLLSHKCFFAFAEM